VNVCFINILEESGSLLATANGVWEWLHNGFNSHWNIHQPPKELISFVC